MPPETSRLLRLSPWGRPCLLPGPQFFHLSDGLGGLAWEPAGEGGRGGKGEAVGGGGRKMKREAWLGT